jgi:hypothetical protein
MTDNALRYHIGTVGLPDEFVQCVKSVTEVAEFLRDAARDVEESAANDHDESCEHCRPAMENGERPDCLGMDESTDASAILSSIADGDLTWSLSAFGIGGAAVYKIGDTHYSVRVTAEFESIPCDGKPFNSVTKWS